MIKISRELAIKTRNKVEIQSLVKNSRKSLRDEKEEQGREGVSLPNSSTTLNPRRMMTIKNKGEGN